MPALPLSRRALAALALVFALPALAEDWPDTDWPRAQQPAGPALEAFERYASAVATMFVAKASAPTR
ncbi:putative beta-lactamase [Pseudomonas aeruginosa]|nr:putative beta-lactamase [Pseudomonas aeruginosa]